VAQGAVLYVAAERAALVKRRMAAWRKHHGIDDLPLAVLQGTIDLRSSKATAEEIAGHARDLRDETGQRLRLIVIDTVSRALNGGDENSPKDMGALVGNATEIQMATGAAVCLLHHIPADGSQRMRGHGALLGAVDTTLAVEKSATVRTATIDKANDSEEGERLTFTLESVEIADDGTTAPVVVQADAPFAPATRAKGRPNKAATIALRALADAISEVGEPAPASSHIPQAARVTTRTKWQDYASRIGISASEDPGSQRKAFNRAAEHLIAGQSVGVWNEHVWLCQ
jgi:hypothetical protein